MGSRIIVPTQSPDSDTEYKRKTRVWSMSDFDLGPVVGRGRFGQVHASVERSTGHAIAIKVIDKTQVREEQHDQQVFNEMVIHSDSSIHPHVISLYTYFHDYQSIYLVMELAKHRSLYELMQEQTLKRFPDQLSAKFIFQTADALNFLHTKHYMHRDIKPENILIDEHQNAKLSDFGWAVPLIEEPQREYCGTRDYIAPEVLLGVPYDERIDNWCLGVLCFELLVGRSPFHSKKLKTSYQKIINVTVRFPKFVSSEAREFIMSLVAYDPVDRLSLEHLPRQKWITSHLPFPPKYWS